jgi:hypothetical protein
LIHAGDYYVRILARERVRYNFSKEKRKTRTTIISGKIGNKFGRERELRKGHISHQTTLIREICHAIDSLFIIHLVFLSLSFLDIKMKI